MAQCNECGGLDVETDSDGLCVYCAHTCCCVLFCVESMEDRETMLFRTHWGITPCDRWILKEHLPRAVAHAAEKGPR